MAWAGLSLICLGIVSMATDSRRGEVKGIVLALSSSVLIASFTLVDGIGVRRSGTPIAYALWIFVLSGLPLLIWACLARRARFASNVSRYWHLGLIGGVGTLGSYGLALWAMSVAPLALVAALRETSILFGTAISGMVLKERVGPIRMAAACLMALGAAALRLA